MLCKVTLGVLKGASKLNVLLLLLLYTDDQINLVKYIFYILLGRNMHIIQYMHIN